MNRCFLMAAFIGCTNKNSDYDPMPSDSDKGVCAQKCAALLVEPENLEWGVRVEPSLSASKLNPLEYLPREFYLSQRLEGIQEDQPMESSFYFFRDLIQVTINGERSNGDVKYFESIDGTFSLYSSGLFHRWKAEGEELSPFKIRVRYLQEGMDLEKALLAMASNRALLEAKKVDECRYKYLQSTSRFPDRVTKVENFKGGRVVTFDESRIWASSGVIVELSDHFTSREAFDYRLELLDKEMDEQGINNLLEYYRTLRTSADLLTEVILEQFPSELSVMTANDMVHAFDKMKGKFDLNECAMFVQFPQQ